ncbi:MAG: MarC family protein [Methanomicrobiales archaeon]|nr:MarC family protein [Methanomicrobiales archaeon]
MLEILPSIVYAFGALFIILDPLLSVPIFVDMTRDLSRKEANEQAWVAVIVAGLLMYVFLFFNFLIFDTLGITLASFQVAGGILLFILGMQEALGIEIPHARSYKHNAAGVVIGTPLLCGPGTITTVLLLSSEFGLFVPFVAITLALLATWLILRYASQIQRLIGELATDILAKVLGMLVAAIAIQIITEGIIALV